MCFALHLAFIKIYLSCLFAQSINRMNSMHNNSSNYMQDKPLDLCLYIESNQCT